MFNLLVLAVVAVGAIYLYKTNATFASKVDAVIAAVTSVFKKK